MKLKIREHSLNEDIEAVKKYYPKIPDDTFMQLVALDPTYNGKDSLGKYGKWLLNLFNRGSLSEEEFSEVTPLLNQFTTYRNRIQNKDLNAYKSLDELAEILASVVDDDSMLTPSQKTKFLKRVKSGKIQTGRENNYDTVYEDSNWVVWIPNTHEASMKLGKGTEWCTAHENPEWFDKYTYEDGEEFSLYIMKNKHTGKRFQYCDNPYRGYDYQFMDEKDHDVDTEEFMTDCMEYDYDFAEWLHDLNPEFFKLVIFIGDFEVEEGTAVRVRDYFEPNVVISEGITTIGEELFYESELINKLYVSSKLERIEANAFYDSSLISINLDDAYSLSFIDAGAFMFCENLHCIINLPNVQFIGHMAFAYSGITQLYIGNDLAILCEGAFAGCENLTYVEIEGCSKELTIQKGTFTGCPKLKEVHLPANIYSIAKDAFVGCDNDLTLYTDSQWVRDNIESLNINLCNSYGDEIYIKDKGFVD